MENNIEVWQRERQALRQRLEQLEKHSAELELTNVALQESEHHHRQLTDALRETTRILGSTLDLSDVLSRVLSHLAKVIEHEASLIMLLEENDLRVVAAAGLLEGEKTSDLTFALANNPVLSHSLRIRNAIPLGDLTKGIPFDEMLAAHNILSCLLVPLLSMDEPIGVLTVCNAAPHSYDHDTVAVVQAFANQAAVAIENARLFQMISQQNKLIKQRADRLELLYNMSILLNSYLDLDSVLFLVAKEMSQTFGVEQSDIVFFDEQREYGQLVAEYRQQGGQPGLGPIIPIRGNPIAEHAIHTKEPLVIVDVESEPLLDSIRHLLSHLLSNVKSILIVPLIVQNEVMGVIRLDSLEKQRRWLPDEIALAQTIANQIAVAVRNAQLYEETQRRLKEQATLYEASKILSSSLDIDEVLHNVAKQMSIALGVEGCTISDWDEEANVVITRVEHDVGPSGSNQDLPGTTYDLNDYPATLKVLRTGQPMSILVSDESHDAQERALLEKLNLQSLLMVPLVIKGRSIGLAELRDYEERRFSPEEIQLAQTLAGQAAVVIENAHLYKETQQRLREQATLYTASMALSSSLDLEQVLDAMISEAGGVLGSEAISVLLLDEGTKELIFELSVGSGAKQLKGHRLPPGAGIAGWVVQQGCSVLVSGADEDPRFYSRVDDIVGTSTRSLLGVPLKVKDRIIGVIEAVNKIEGRFDHNDLRLLEALARSAALAIENARLYEATVRQLDRMSSLTRASTTISSHLGLSKVLAAIADESLNVLKADRCAIFLGEMPDLRCVLARHLSSEYVWGINYRYRQLLQELSLAISTSPRPLIIADVLEHPQLSDRRELVQREGYSSLALLPLRRGEITVGLLALYYDQPKSYLDEEIETAQVFANQATAAIENSRLYAEADRERGKLAAILEDTADVVLATDEENRVLIMNSPAERAFAVPAPKALGLPLAQAIPSQPLLELFERAAEGGEQLMEEIETPHGRTFHASVSAVMGVGWVAVMQDITRLKELDRLKSELVATASHDLKNPLGAIIGFADLLPMLGKFNEKQQSCLDNLKRSANSMLALIEDLLDIAKIEAGVELELKFCQLSGVVQEMVDSLTGQARAKNVALAVKWPANLPPVYCDLNRLRQVLTNLVGNALKYTLEGGKVTIRLEPIGGEELESWKAGRATIPRFRPFIEGLSSDTNWLAVSVSDTGIGIPPEDQEHLFETFYRVNNEITRDIEGTGLGLAIVKSIVEQHGGGVWVESEWGVGSTFGFVLPVQDDKEQAKGGG